MLRRRPTTPCYKGRLIMASIREKIESRASNDNDKDRDYLNRALMRMSWIILAGYLIGTGIALFIERG